MNNFHQILNDLTVPDLKKCLPFLTGGSKPTRKADLIEHIYNDCKQHHMKYWLELDNLEKQVVAEMVYQDNDDDDDEIVFDATQFEAKYGEIPKYFKRHSWSDRNKSNTSFLTLFVIHGKMPNEYRQWMREDVKKPHTSRIATISEDKIPSFIEYEADEFDQKYGAQSNPKIKILHTEEMLTRDLESVLRFIESGQCMVSDKTKRPTAVTVRKLDEILLGGDYYQPDEVWDVEKWSGSPIRPIRPFSWPLLMQSSGLARRVGKKLTLTNNGKKAFNAPLERTIKTMYQRWRNKGLLDEFSRIDMIKGQASKGRVMTAVPPRRKAIESILQQCPADGEWIGVDSLFQYMKSVGTELEITHNEWKLYIADSEYGALGYSGFHDFEILQGRYILAYFFEYLATMGMLDIAYTTPYKIREDYHDMWGIDDIFHLSRYDGLLFFRINPLGAYCLDMVGSYQPSVIKKSVLLTINEALHIHLLRTPAPSETMVLERYSKPLSATEWQLTEKSSLQAMDNGFSADKFKEFLLENSEQKNLATEVNYFFKAAFERENALTDMGSARLLHCYSKPFATCWQMHAKPNNIAAMQEIRPWLSLKKRKRNLHRAYVS